MSGFMQGSAALFSGVKSLWNKITGAGVTNAQQQTMNFNAQQAELDRQFQSAEAEKARQWQEDYYQQYQSPSALMSQYRDAGLNPALMYGQSGTSSAPPSTSVPSGASASAGMPEDSVSSLLSMIMQAVVAKSQINKNNADAAAANANAKETNQRIEFNPQIWNMNFNKGYAEVSNMKAGVDLMLEQVKQVKANVLLTNAQVEKVLAEADNIDVDTAKKRLEKDGVELRNDLLAEEIVKTKLEQALTAAQTALTSAQTKNVKVSTIAARVKEIFNINGMGDNAKNIWELIDKRFGNLFTMGDPAQMNALHDMMKELLNQ